MDAMDAMAGWIEVLAGHASSVRWLGMRMKPRILADLRLSERSRHGDVCATYDFFSCLFEMTVIVVDDNTETERENAQLLIDRGDIVRETHRVNRQRCVRETDIA